MESTLFSLFWEGFTVNDWTSVDRNQLIIHLKAISDSVPICSRCGKPTPRIHDVHIRRIRERNLIGHRLWLLVPLRRVHCSACGPTLELVTWLSPYARMTKAMIEHVEERAARQPIKHVAAALGLDWHTVQRIDHQRLQREYKEPDRSSLRRLILDEFALFKGHHYATVALCADTKRVLWIGQGRSREAIKPLFEWLGPEACNQIEAVAMDMNTAFDLEVKAHCPQARIVYDLFHVLAKYGREVIDTVRTEQVRTYENDPAGRRMIKRSRWLLLRGNEKLPEGQKTRLKTLLEANQELMIVYLLKMQLKELWYAPSEKLATQRWRAFYLLARESGIKALQLFARRLKPYLAGIVSSAVFRLNTSLLEGINNKIKLIKRMAYGYRNVDYFFLKIKDAFPGITR